MTLCAVWRDRDTLHIASDGGRDHQAGMNLASGRFMIRAAEDVLSGDIAFCFVGSGSAMVHLKEAMTRIFDGFEPAPGYDDISFEGIARIAFAAYRAITQTLSSSIGRKSFCRVVVAGRCYRTSSLRVFRFGTEVIVGSELRHHIDELLKGSVRHVFIGDGAPAARTLAGQRTPPLSSRELLSIIHQVIEDPVQIGAAGSIQYGRFEGADFRLFEVRDRDSEAHAWRAAPELREKYDADFPIGYPTIPMPGGAR